MLGTRGAENARAETATTTAAAISPTSLMKCMIRQLVPYEIRSHTLSSLAPEAAAAALSGPTLLVLMGCKHARCGTRFCRYLKEAEEAKHEATLKRPAHRRRGRAPTHAGRKANPGQSSPGAGIDVPPPHTAMRAKRAKQVCNKVDLTGPTPLQGGWRRDNTGRAASSANPPHAILSPSALMRGTAIAPPPAPGDTPTEKYGSTDADGEKDLVVPLPQYVYLIVCAVMWRTRMP